ncbi:MAG: hypothetical protein UC961_06070 [Emergencia sp.]|mgnify:FL=1|nr:hypothetical protein [Emergencia sp.]
MENANYIAWISGIYVTYSIASVLNEKADYPEKPAELFPTEKSLREKEENLSKLFAAHAILINKGVQEKD